MTVYEAIKRMRQLTSQGRTFAVSFMTCSLSRRTSEGERTIEHATLVKNPKPDKAGCKDTDYSDYMLTLRDADTGDVRQCWQPLVMSLDHQPLTNID